MHVLIITSDSGPLRLVCHGLEALEAGCSDAARMDYAAAEAGLFVADRTGLPAQVSLLSPSLSYMNGSGQRCEGAEELAEAVRSRCAAMHPDRKPGWRVEVHAEGVELKLVWGVSTREACAGLPPFEGWQ